MEPGVQFFMVGLPDSAVKESHQRIEASLKNNGYRIPGKKIVITWLLPIFVKKVRPYDLPLAMEYWRLPNK